MKALDGLHFGTVSAVDEKTGMVRVRLPDLNNLRTDWLQVLYPKTLQDKCYCMPDLGEHVAILLDENGEDGVVLGAVYSTADKPPVVSRDKWHRRFKDGTVLEYDRSTHTFTVDGPAQINLISSSQVNVKSGQITLDADSVICTGGMTVKGPLTVESTLHATGNISSAGSIIDAGGNSNHHSH